MLRPKHACVSGDVQRQRAGHATQRGRRTVAGPLEGLNGTRCSCTHPHGIHCLVRLRRGLASCITPQARARRGPPSRGVVGLSRDALRSSGTALAVAMWSREREDGVLRSDARSRRIPPVRHAAPLAATVLQAEAGAIPELEGSAPNRPVSRTSRHRCQASPEVASGSDAGVTGATSVSSTTQHWSQAASVCLHALASESSPRTIGRAVEVEVEVEPGVSRGCKQFPDR